MNTLITTLIAGLAWWPQGRHDAANTGRIYGHGKIHPGMGISVTTIDLGLPIESRYGATVGDVDGLGDNEILVVAGAYSGSNLLAVLHYDGPNMLQIKYTWTYAEGNPIAIDCAPALCDVGWEGHPGSLDGFPDAIWTLGNAGILQAVDFAGAPGFPGLIWRGYDSWVDPSSPTVADFNKDGVHDVVVGFQQPPKLYLIDGGTGMSMSERLTDDKIYCKPAAGDIDNDGDPEIVVVDRGGDVYYWDNPGNITETFTKILDYTPSSPYIRAGWASPVLCNLDYDPGLEIVVYLTKSTTEAEIIAMDEFGNRLWTATVPSNIGIHYYTAGSPAVCDLNGDGTVDVVVATTYNSVGRIYAFNGGDGSVLSGFPVAGLEAIHTAPAIADVMDADGLLSTYDPEIVAVGIDGQLYIIGANGTILLSHNLDDFPSDTILAAPTIADCDDDGALEIVVCRGKGGNLGRVYVIDGPALPEPAWAEIPITSYNPQPLPSWNARFLDASVMPPAKAVDHEYGVDPNMSSNTMVVVGYSTGKFPAQWNPLNISYIAYYSYDGGLTWEGSEITDNQPIVTSDLRASRYILAGVHLMPQIAFEPPILNGVAVGYAYVSHAGIDKWYGCILVTSDGGASWGDWTGDLLGVTDPQFLPSAPLTDVTVVTNGGDHKTWIVGFQGYGGQIITGKLIPGGLDFGISPTGCGQVPWIDLYGVHAYYPYPGIVQQSVWVTGRWGRGSIGGGYINWGYQADPENPNSIHWGTSPCCSEEVAEFHDAIYDLWDQGAQMPSLPGHSNFWSDVDEAGITDSVFAAGIKRMNNTGQGVIFGTVDKLRNYQIRSYPANRALYDISTFEYPALRRYVFGEGPIRYWDVEFTKGDGLLPDETPPIAIKNDFDNAPPDRVLYGSADNAGIAVGRMSMSNLPTIWKKGSFEYVESGELTPIPFGPPEITWTRSQNNGRVAWVVWNHNTEPTVRDYRIRAYPMGQGSEDWSSLLTFNVETFMPLPNDSGYWEGVGVKAVDCWGTESQASDDLGDTSLFYHPGPAAVSDTLALFPSSTENLVVDYDGVAHLVYASRSLEDGEYHIYYIARPFGGAWSEPQDLGRGYAPTIALGNDNLTIHLAYTDVVGMTTDLYYRSKSPGGGWGAKVRLLKMTPGSGYIGIGAPALDVKGSVAHIAWKSGIKRGNSHKNCGYALLYGTLNTGNPRDFTYSELDRIEFQARDIDDYKRFVHHLAGVSAAVGRTTGTVHIVWDGDRDRMRVFQRKPGYGWVKCDLSITQYTTSEREPCLRVYRDGFYPSKIGVDTASIAEIAFVGDIGRSIAIFYAQVKEGVEVSSPIILDYTYSEFGRLSTPFLEEGYAVWSRKWSKPTEIRNEILARKIPKPGTTTPIEIVSLSPWVKSLNPEMVCYSWGASPQWLLLYTEYEKRDGEAGLVKRSRDKRWEPRASYHFLGGENPAFITDYREGHIIYDDTLFEQGKASDTASERLIYTFYEVSDTAEYELGLVFYHQEPDTQALRVIIYSDTYAVYVPPYERYYWQMPVMSHSAITFSVEKQEAKRAFLSEAYLFPTGEGKGGPQSQGPGAMAFSLSTYPSISKRGFSISLSLPLRQEIDLSLYDVTGRLALSLAKGVYAPGSYEFRIEPHTLSSGIYYLRLMSP
ncbi:MAG: hypothetical protein ABIM19_08215, partial [candidate division WOR-3 bacterium]